METNGSGGLQLKGVVFNEMKGAMQDASSVFHRALYSSVFHKCTHHHNRYSVLITPPSAPSPSTQRRRPPRHTLPLARRAAAGAQPSPPPSLPLTFVFGHTLLQFHALHYHPSAARFITYGSFPVDRHLSALHDLALSKFTRRTPPSLLLEPQRRCRCRRLPPPPAAAARCRRRDAHPAPQCAVCGGHHRPARGCRVASRAAGAEVCKGAPLQPNKLTEYRFSLSYI